MQEEKKKKTTLLNTLASFRKEKIMDNDYYNDRMLSKWEEEYLEPEDEEEDFIDQKRAYEEDFYCDEIKGIY